MPAAVIPAAVAAAGTIGGAILASGEQKSAANKAVQAQTSATSQQLQLGRESLATQKQMFDQGLALNHQIYDANFSTLSPFVGNGLVASNAMNALLGLPAAQPMTSPLATAPVAPGIPTPPPPAPGPVAPGAMNPASLNPSTALQALGSYYANR
jgi:hypothetical protein